MIRTRMPYVASADLKRFDFFTHIYTFICITLPYDAMCTDVHIHIHLRLRMCACLKHTINGSLLQRYNVHNVFYIHTTYDHMIFIKCAHCK